MKACNLIVKGRVQRVGYRRYVIDNAHELGLSGNASNEDDGSVCIFVQGEESIVNTFINIIKEPPHPAKVKELQVQEVSPVYDIKGFRIIYKDPTDEFQEGLGAMQNIFIEYLGEFRDFANRTDENFGTLLSRYGDISEKMTIILETLKKGTEEGLRKIDQQIAEGNKRFELLQKELIESKVELRRSIDILTELVRNKLD